MADEQVRQAIDNLLPKADPFDNPAKHDNLRSTVDIRWLENEQGSFGQESPIGPDLPFGTQFGERAPGFDAIRAGDDVSGAMATYQDQLVRMLTTIQKLLLETTNRIEALEGYFDRMR